MYKESIKLERKKIMTKFLWISKKTLPLLDYNDYWISTCDYAFIHQGKEKKKLKLLDRVIKLLILVQLFKAKMLTFPLYSINVTQTAKAFDQLISNLDESSILKVQYF